MLPEGDRCADCGISEDDGGDLYLSDYSEVGGALDDWTFRCIDIDRCRERQAVKKARLAP